MGAQTYHVVLKEDEDGWYAVQCVELPGAISQGRTKEEALVNIKDAIKLLLEHLANKIREKNDGIGGICDPALVFLFDPYFFPARSRFRLS